MPIWAILVLVLLANENLGIEIPAEGGNNSPPTEQQLPCPRPPDFPQSIPLTQQTFQNWDVEILVKDVWTAIPRTPHDILDIANWAAIHNYRVRALGFSHTWSPLVMANDDTCYEHRIILVRTIDHLTQIKMDSVEHSKSSKPSVTVQTGASMMDLLTYLERNGFGFHNFAVPGDLSVGGVLAVGAHGVGVRVRGQPLSEGFSAGSMSNLIVSFTAVVWDEQTNKFVLRTFQRSDKEAKAFLTSLGRAFLIEVTLRVGHNYNLQAISKTDIPADELFSVPTILKTAKRTFSSFLESTGRIEAIWYPYTPNPWTRIYKVSPAKPSTSRFTTDPYNYIFPVAKHTAEYFKEMLGGKWWLTPGLEQSNFYETVIPGLVTLNSRDIWGSSKNVLIALNSTTSSKVSFQGTTIITSRSNVQHIVSSVYQFYENLLRTYQSNSKFPMNGPMYIRTTGLDLPEDIGIPLAESPSFSPIRPVPDRPELDCAIWINFLSFPQTPDLSPFLKEIESFYMNKIHDGKTAVVRPEWSKTWGHSDGAAFSDPNYLHTVLPSLFSGTSETDGWNWAVSTLNKYDPKHVFSNDFLDKLLVEV